MKILKALTLVCVISILNFGCFEDRDDNVVLSSDINDFVWKAMNVWYLYKDDVPDLANDRFSSNEAYGSYLNSFSSPEELFESLIYQRGSIDKFSWITSNYFVNEDFLNGINLTNGMRFATFSIGANNPERYGIVLYVLPNTSADAQGVKRGDIFYGIDGSQLTTTNGGTLLSQDSYTINLGNYDTNGTPETADDFVTATGENISLTKAVATANPIFKTNIIDLGSEKVGYLMYNQFTGSSAELNDVFGNFKSAGVTELVVDLRYNPGGFTSKATMLASLITGQFEGEILNINQYNNEIQAAYEAQNPEFLVTRFISSEDGMALNSLNLDKVYILTSNNSASASELVINSLRPYLNQNLIQIGSNTAGKYQGSRTLYDSEAPNFSKEGVNPNHTYALQPLIFKYSNVAGNTDFVNGLSPDIGFEIRENILNLGVLGTENEPLLAMALMEIENSSGRFSNNKSSGVIAITTDLDSTLGLPNGGLMDDKALPK